MPLVTNTWRVSIVCGAVLAALLAIVTFLLVPAPLHTWYYIRFVGPLQQERFGFTASYPTGYDCLEISSVTPGGAFDRAGIRPGFAPALHTSFGLSQAELLFLNLRNAKSGALRLEFYEGGCEAKTGFVRVTVQVPSDADAG